VAAALVTAALAVAGPAAADVVLPAVIGDHMVLQRETSAPIWGWAAPGERVRVEGGWPGATAETAADERGRWQVRIPTGAAGGPFTMTISGSTSITLENVMIGEVWICSGQSNMEWPVTRARNAAEEIDTAHHPGIRLFTVPNTIATRPRIDCRGSWVECSPATVRSFSATGYFFGRDLHQRLDVPIGLIAADWGGTIVEAWMSESTLGGFSEYTSTLEFLDVVSDPNRRTGVVEDRVKAWWSGLDDHASVPRGWTATDHDDTGWPTMNVPETWTGKHERFDGVIRFRRTVSVPAAWAGRPATLELGPIDDYDDVWVNGVHVAATHAAGNWNKPRRYEVPARVLVGGPNVVAVRILDTGGLGGMNGKPEQMKLTVAGGGDPVALAGVWRYHVGRAQSKLPRRPQGANIGPNTGTVLYNGMIAPVVPYAIRGAIWYQGESNRPRAHQYRTLFPALIDDWRARWGRGDFPFYYVQIAPFRYGGDTGQAAALREAQTMAMHRPNTGMVVTMDVGNPDDIHPRNKQAVGRRLARWARARTYGEAGLVPSGPLYRSMRIEGDAVRIEFDHVGPGLVLRDSDRSHFTVAGADRVFVEAQARIDGDAIVVSTPRVPDPVAVRYAWEAAAEPNLFNGADLPASPFRTDAWEK
jgi:sialate O-acetylesterase